MKCIKCNITKDDKSFTYLNSKRRMNKLLISKECYSCYSHNIIKCSRCKQITDYNFLRLRKFNISNIYKFRQK